MEKLKDNIFKLIQNRDHVSFAELSEIDGFGGEYGFTVKEFKEKNIWMWFSCSKKAIDCLIELLNDKKIEIKPATYLIYLIDGLMPKVELAKQARKYKTDRWLPVIFCLT